MLSRSFEQSHVPELSEEAGFGVGGEGEEPKRAVLMTIASSKTCMEYPSFLSFVINTDLWRKGLISAYKLCHWGKLGQELRLGTWKQEQK